MYPNEHQMQPAEDLHPLLLPDAAAARFIGLGKTKLRELTAAGEIPSVTIGRRRLWPVAGLRDFVAKLSAGGA